jgi:hypothetical protein
MLFCLRDNSFNPADNDIQGNTVLEMAMDDHACTGIEGNL